MRKNSDKAPIQFSGSSLLAGFALIAALVFIPGATFAQESSPPPSIAANASKLGLTAFIEVSPEIRVALDLPNPTKASLLEAAMQAGKTTPLASTLSLLANSVLSPLPPPANGGSILVSPAGSAPLFTLGPEALVSCGRLIAGFFSLKKGIIVNDIYLLESEKENAEKLGSFTGSFADLDNYGGTLGQFLLPRFSNAPLRIVDFSISPQGSLLSLSSGLQGKTDEALLIGARLFIYKENKYDILIKKSGYVTVKYSVSTPLKDMYNIIHIDLAIDESTTQGSLAAGFKAASDQMKWAEEKRFATASMQFSAALGRLVLSLPVSAIALGLLFQEYEVFSRRPPTADILTSLWLSGGAAALSLGLSVAFVIDSGIHLGSLISTAR